MSAPLLLASASSRRRSLLEQIGARFEVVVSDVPETPASEEAPLDFVQRIACEKAQAVSARRPGSWVLGADTVVVIGDAMLGKPADAADAHAMLEKLSGCEHRVLTGVGLVAPDGSVQEAFVVSTSVTFRSITEEEIDAYIISGEPLDKAGAYAIQGGGARFVDDLRGSYTNVIGLPLEEARALLDRHGLLPGRDRHAGTSGDD
jgi:septum formation protein